ncbi:zinc-binding dehydrogenase [Dictyobacter aurantiacus]|uniref:zinc-binding dehydrogenase n=1 Tax=Dictyobacter aurantiacus TaxID=1936993 RepID=UPI000F82BB07|nr:zinc-binding dehydrogenase [Dictyobacter aurantiacus]
MEIKKNASSPHIEGQVRTFVGGTFPLHEAAQAQEFSQKGHGRGRIVLHVA